jgi:glyoxylase I family protein
MPTFPPFSHVALTVTDLDSSVPWYNRLLEAKPVMDLDDGDFRRKVYALPGGQLLGLTAHRGTASGDRFNEKRPGLDHLGFSCTSRDEVQAWADRLSELAIDHSGIVDAPYGAVLSFKDPDGNALEFFAMGA